MPDPDGKSSSKDGRSHPTSLRLARRALGHRRWQTLIIVVASALISGTAIFAAGYQRLIYQVVVDQTFAAGGSATAWTVRSPPGVDQRSLLPPGWESFAQPPVEGRIADVLWSSPDAVVNRSIRGTQRWRDDMCSHVVLVSGRCPVGGGDVAISATDATTWSLGPGDSLTARSTLSPSVELTVSGIYQVDDREDPYWFELPPVGKSLFQEEVLQSDDLFTAAGAIELPSYQNTLDLRLDPSTVDVSDLAGLGVFSRQLGANVVDNGTLVSGVPDSLERIVQERRRAVTGLTISLAQLAVVVGVVLALLAAVELSGQRAEMGLARLRGESAAGVHRLITLQWAAVVAVGWLIGCVLGTGVLLLVAVVLPGTLARFDSLAMVVGPALALAVMAGVIVPPARALLVQPATTLLRSAPSAVRDPGGRQLLADAILAMLTISGLVVALQVSTDSVLGLLTPSLLAIGSGIILFRVLVWLAGRRRRRLAQLGARPSALLRAILTFRLRGLRLLVITTTVAAAFAVFTMQLLAIGGSVRGHDAEVRTGAAAVVSIEGAPAAVVAELARFEPQYSGPAATMTPVALTRREDPRAVRGMFVEPAAFTQIAYGADQAAAEDVWSAILAPRVDPVTFQGETVSVRVGRHKDLSAVDPGPPTRQGTRADLAIAYLSADGLLHTQTLGPIQMVDGGGERLEQPVLCRDGCRLLRITLTPNGPVSGTLPLDSFAALSGGRAQPIDFGAADRWPSVPTNDPVHQLRVQPGPGGLVLTVNSAGDRLEVQHTFAPIAMPVLVAPGSRISADPTLRAPDGAVLRIAPAAETVDAVPGLLDNVAVADLESVLRIGRGADGPQTSVQIWVSEAGLDRLAELQQTMTDAGFRVLGTRTAQEAVAAARITAPALTAGLAPGLAALAAVFAALGIALTVAGQRPVLGRDLAAVRLAGLRDATVRHAATLTYLWPTLLAVALGTVAGAVGCVLVIADLPMLADPQPAIHSDLRVRVATLVGSVGVAAGALTGVVVLSVRLLLRASSADQLAAPR